MSIRFQFVGCGDAFGSGSRYQTCFYVESPSARFLIDCGASSSVALKRFGVDAATLDFIVVTHFHGDHFGGIPFLAVHERIVRRRTAPLTVVGPVGIGERVSQVAETLFPGSTAQPGGLPLTFIEYEAGRPTEACGVGVSAFPVVHSPGTNPHAVRLTCDGRVIAYSGDTEWTDSLIAAADGADLFICEAYFYEKSVPKHLDYATVARHRSELNCRRLVLTHLHDDILKRLRDVSEEIAEDGKRIEII